MKFHQFLVLLAAAIHEEDTQKLSSLLRPAGPNVNELLNDLHDSRRQALERFASSIIQPWGEIAIAHVQVVVNVIDGNFKMAYQEQATLIQAFFRYFSSNTGWTLPLLYSLLRDLRALSAQASDDSFINGERMIRPDDAVKASQEDAARICNKAFSLCVQDRTSPKEISRKWGTYYVVGLVFKCYFRLHTTSLARNVLRAVNANPDIPQLSEFPCSHQVTYRYYLGMLAFLSEEYSQAERELTLAFYGCHAQSKGNLSRILTYLLPLRLLRGHLPSSELLDEFPHLQPIYDPFVEAIRRGDLKAFDEALYHPVRQKRLLDLGLYIIFEKSREVCMRGLFRKVWLVLEKPTRIGIAMFHAGLKAAGQDMPIEEAECFTAIMIYKGFMRGYISHEKQTVVLAASHTFPSLDQRANPYS